jgi:serine/threonine-protein kinase
MVEAALVAAVVGGAVAAAWMALRATPASAPGLVRFTIAPPSNAAFQARGNDRDLAISPDGKLIAYRGLSNGEFVMFVRPIDALESTVLPGVSVGPRHPFFSPDGRWIGFFSTTALWKVAVSGGPALKICDIGGAPRGATWLSDNSIVFASTSGLQRVSAAGGAPQPVATPRKQAGETAYLWPSALPDARGVLFTIRMLGSVDASEVGILDFKTQRTSVLVRGATSPMYAPGDYLVYAAGGGLRAVRLDLSKLEIVGDPVPVLDQVGVSSYGAGEFDIAQTGALVYAAAGSGSMRSLVLVGRDGREEPVKSPPRAYNYPRLSPDGKRIAVDSLDQDSDIWIWDTVRETLTRVTSDPGVDSNPVWTPDGQRLVFASTRDGVANMYEQLAQGGVEADRLHKSADSEFPYVVTPDGRAIVFRHDRTATTHEDLDVLTLADRTTRALVDTPFSEGNADISPDGKWLAFQSTDSGRDEVYVRPFPDVAGGRWQISTAGGNQPLWSRDGRELFYRDNQGGVMAVPVSVAEGRFSPGMPTVVLSTSYYVGPAGRAYDVTKDGRFLMVRDIVKEPGSSRSITVVLNWLDDLKTRVK